MAVKGDKANIGIKKNNSESFQKKMQVDLQC